jgi:trans-aconitate 2-methyltransferase
MAKDSWNPNQYEKFKNERTQPFFDLIDMLENGSDKRIIDLGCGSGELTADLHKRFKGAKTVGLDSSQKMLEKASAFESDSLKFVKGDILTWKPKSHFDIIVSNAALQWCPGHKDVFKKLKEALNPRGQVAIQMPMNHDYPTHVLADKISHEAKWKKVLKNETYDKQRILLTSENYAKLLFDLGFKNQKVLLRVYGHELPSRNDVIEWVKGSLLTFFEGRLSKENFQKFMKEYTERLFNELPDDRPFFYPFKRVFIWGQLS